MYYSKFQRSCMALYYGWGHAKKLAKNSNHSRVWFYFDILHYFFRYGVGSQRYVLYHFERKTVKEKEEAAKMFYHKIFDGRKESERQRIFIEKWSSKKWHTTPRRIGKKIDAYMNFFNTGEELWVEYGVTIYFYHHKRGRFVVGNKVVFARECDLDITGDLIIEDDVSISEGAKILTHRHEYYGLKKVNDCDNIEDIDSTDGCIQTPLHIGRMAWIGARAIILPGVKEIGRSSIIGAGAVVEKRVPPYSIVKGNPARIVGFKYTPEEIVDLEERRYPIEQRIPYEDLKADYEKYFNAERRKEIRQWLKY